MVSATSPSTNPIDLSGNLNTNLNNYVVGGPGDIVLVRTFYTWDIVTPLLRPFFSEPVQRPAVTDVRIHFPQRTLLRSQ